MTPLAALRIRNISIALTIMVIIPPLAFLLSAVVPGLVSSAGRYGIYVFLLYIIVALVGGVGARLRARQHVPADLESGERFAAFASVRQHLVLATNTALVLLPLLALGVGKILDAGIDQSNPFAFSGTGFAFLVVAAPFLIYAAVGAIASLFWLLPARVVRAEQYAIANRLTGHRRIMVARTVNLLLLILGLLIIVWLSLFGLRGMV